MCRLSIHGIRTPPSILLQSLFELVKLEFLGLSEVIEHSGLCVGGCSPCQRGLTAIDVVMGLLLLLRRAGPSPDKLSSHGCAGTEFCDQSPTCLIWTRSSNTNVGNRKRIYKQTQLWRRTKTRNCAQESGRRVCISCIILLSIAGHAQRLWLVTGDDIAPRTR